MYSKKSERIQPIIRLWSDTEDAKSLKIKPPSVLDSLPTLPEWSMDVPEKKTTPSTSSETGLINNKPAKNTTYAEILTCCVPKERKGYSPRLDEPERYPLLCGRSFDRNTHSRMRLSEGQLSALKNQGVKSATNNEKKTIPGTITSDVTQATSSQYTGPGRQKSSTYRAKQLIKRYRDNMCALKRCKKIQWTN